MAARAGPGPTETELLTLDAVTEYEEHQASIGAADLICLNEDDSAGEWCARCMNSDALRTNNLRRKAMFTSVTIGVAAAVGMATVLPGVGAYAAASAGVASPAATVLILGGTTVPTPDAAYVDTVMDQYIVPTHPDQDLTPVAVTTPEEIWPVTGLGRVVGSALGPPSIWGPDGPGWPDEPAWKLSGLFDLTGGQSVEVGVAQLEAAMAEHGKDHLVIYGLSQGAGVANVEKRKLAAQYPVGTTAPDIDFVLSGDPNLPNGGILSRFEGLHIPILDFPFNGPAATDTQFDTVEINRQYDGFTDFPLYPLNLLADLNAVLGIVYVHFYSFDVSLPPDPATSPAYQGTYGDTSYYFFETEDLPLFGPLRTLGVPESVIDVVEPSAKAIVDQGYDRSVAPWEPTPARLFPPVDPVAVATDFVQSVGEGLDNAVADLIGTTR